MKKLLGVFLVLFYSLVFAKDIFEEIAYQQTKANDRYMYVYTNTNNKKDMIKYGKSKLHTPGQETVVHFFSNKEYVPHFTDLNNLDYTQWLTGVNEKYKEHMIGTYYKDRNGKEKWFYGSDATVDKNKYEMVK